MLCRLQLLVFVLTKYYLSEYETVTVYVKCICERAHALKLPTKDHKCFLNWDKAATGMEADGISEGFGRSIELHGLKFNRLIGNFIKYNLYNKNTYDSIINNRNIKNK